MKGSFSLAFFFRSSAPPPLPSPPSLSLAPCRSPSLACHLHLESKASRFKEELACGSVRLSVCPSVDGAGSSFCSSFAPPPPLSSSSSLTRALFAFFLPLSHFISPSFLKATHRSTQHTTHKACSPPPPPPPQSSLAKEDGMSRRRSPFRCRFFVHLPNLLSSFSSCDRML